MMKYAVSFGKWITKIIHYFYFPIFKKYISEETFKYGTTGGFNFMLDITLYYIFYHYIFKQQVLNLHFISISAYIAAYMFVFPITFIVGFYFAKFVTFTDSELKGKKQLFRYGISVVGGILITYILLKIFVEDLHMYATPSKFIISVIGIVYSFFMQKLFTFKTGISKKNK